MFCRFSVICFGLSTSLIENFVCTIETYSRKEKPQTGTGFYEAFTVRVPIVIILMENTCTTK